MKNKGRSAKRMAFYSLIRRPALGLSVGKKIGFVDRSGRPLEVTFDSQQHEWSTTVIVPMTGSV
jgi:hypothetical protein